jgi:hypothetical protein
VTSHQAPHQSLIEHPLEFPSRKVSGDLDDRPGWRGNRYAVGAANITRVGRCGAVDQDAALGPAAAPDDRHVDPIRLRAMSKSPAGSGGMMTEDSAVSTREDRG